MFLIPLAILLLLLGFLYERRAEASFRARTRPPGQLVDVGGRRLHVIIQGETRPGQSTVILEAGHGAWSSCWQKVLPEIATFARVIAYDRAGYGWSDPGNAEPSPECMTASLHALLERLGEHPPYLLVGHSMGGALARRYDCAYPGEVAGMVWIDSVHEELRRFLPVGGWAFRAAELGLRLGALLARVGLPRAAGLGRVIARYPSVRDPQDQDALVEQVITPQFFQTIAAETVVLGDPRGWQRADPRHGPLPVISLEAQYSGPPPFWMPGQFRQRFRGGWGEMHAVLSGGPYRIRRVPVPGGHVIMDEDPQAVIEAVRALLAEVSKSPGAVAPPLATTEDRSPL